MIVQFLFWTIVAVFTGSCTACLTVGYHLGRSDAPPPRRQPLAGEHPYPEGDAFDAAIQTWLDEDVHLERERLADTGELRALALAGNADEIAAQTAAYKKE